jgi:iron(III) transport system substrate-binding protein
MGAEAPERVTMRKWVVAVVVACALAGLPAPASAAPVTVGEIANYAGNDRQKILEDRAKIEGALTIYTTGTQIAPLVDRFKQKYPFVKVQMLRASSIDVATKVTQEYSAGVYIVDAFELNSDGLILPRDQGVRSRYIAASAELRGERRRSRPPLDQRARVNRHRLQHRKIPPAQAQDLQDLLDPRWKGRWRSRPTGTAGNWVGAMVVTHEADFGACPPAELGSSSRAAPAN